MTFGSMQLKLIFKGNVLEGKKEQDFVCIPQTCILGLSGRHVGISFKLKSILVKSCISTLSLRDSLLALTFSAVSYNSYKKNIYKITVS